MKIQLIVSGSRYLNKIEESVVVYNFWLYLNNKKKELGVEELEVEVVAGAAKGVDKVIFDLVKENPVVGGLRLKNKSFLANWATYEKSAGPIRNRRMLDYAPEADVLAFPRKSSKGTRDMIREATARGHNIICLPLD